MQGATVPCIEKYAFNYVKWYLKERKEIKMRILPIKASKDEIIWLF